MFILKLTDICEPIISSLAKAYYLTKHKHRHNNPNKIQRSQKNITTYAVKHN